MKRFFAIVLLTGVFAMNMDMLCRSLCMVGHGNMNHASHHNMTKHEMPQGEMCPITHKAHHNAPHHATPQTSIKCDCSTDQEASIGYELTIAEPVLDLKPHLNIVSKVNSQEIIFLSREPIPLEAPPKIPV